MSTHEVKVSRTIDAKPERVWRALTDPDLVARWMMGARVSSSWKPGEAVTWQGTYDGKPFTDKGSIIEADAPSRLVHTHYSPTSGQPDQPDNYHRLSWTLRPSGTKTTLTLRQSGATSDEEARRFTENWRSMLDGLRTAAEDATARTGG